MTIVSLSGASGVGKSTLVASLANHFGGGRVLCTTTRKQRSTDDRYEFVSLSEMSRMNPLECVLPPIIVHGNWYAARRSAFADALKQTSGEFAGIDITPERHKLVREHFRGLQKTVSIHLLSPTENELRARLSERNWKAEELELRIRDSGRFDQWARQEGGMFFLSPNTKDTIFEACLRLIETTNPV